MKKKIFNDPVYGFVSYPHKILYELIDHKYFQRLRRIRQLGLTHYVYPGALHTRFHHALGALHLMTETVSVLRDKGVKITEKESEAVSIAILLHDIGHGPFSHALEHLIVEVDHEQISLWFMEKLNEEFEGRLDMAISIFKGTYYKPFLHELVSSQLDVDRLDYITRDSFFTGVAEGVIGYDRIIKMLDVKDNHLVVEVKGIYSIEKFLVARRLMYWQVYLHKTVLSAEQMLIALLKRCKFLLESNVKISMSPSLYELLKCKIIDIDNKLIVNNFLELFAKIDDVDIEYLIKTGSNHSDFILTYICKSILERKLFKIYLHDEKPSQSMLIEIAEDLEKKLKLHTDLIKSLILVGQESNLGYNSKKEEIRILHKNGDVQPLSEFDTEFLKSDVVTKYYICTPKKP